MSNVDLLTVHDVALMLSRPVRTVQHQAHQGLIPVALKLPGATGQYLFDPAEVAKLQEAAK